MKLYQVSTYDDADIYLRLYMEGYAMPVICNSRELRDYINKRIVEMEVKYEGFR